MYASLHTTVFGPNEKLIQIQIKTLKQDNLNTYGITAYWREFKGEAPRKMQYDLKEKFQFFKSLDFLNSIIENNDEYLKKIKTEVFTNNIYVYSLKGQVIELPASSTPIDFAYKIHTEIGNKIDKVIINGQEAGLDTPLKSKDRVRIITSDIITVQDNWLSIVKTTYAKRKIKEVLNKK